MAGDSIAQAKAAVIEELINFFHDPNQKEVLRLAVEKANYLTQQVAELVKKRLQKTTLPPEIEAALSVVGDSFTS
jgi:outer membrane protein TolC